LIGGVLGVLASQFLEITANVLGFGDSVRLLVHGGISAMFEGGYDNLVIYGLVFFVGASAAIWIDYWIRAKTTVTIEKTTKIKKFVRNKLFRNQTVPLDGYSYEQCEFRNVTFLYNGGKADLLHNKLYGCTVSSSVPEINDFVFLLHQIGMLKVAVYNSDGTLKNENILVKNDKLNESPERAED